MTGRFVLGLCVCSLLVLPVNVRAQVVTDGLSHPASDARPALESLRHTAAPGSHATDPGEAITFAGEDFTAKHEGQ
jgi:hypothetical protein